MSLLSIDQRNAKGHRKPRRPILPLKAVEKMQRVREETVIATRVKLRNFRESLSRSAA